MNGTELDSSAGNRRGFPRIGIHEDFKLQVQHDTLEFTARAGRTIDISRGGLRAELWGGPIPENFRCIVRFASRERVRPQMIWGVVVEVEQRVDECLVTIEFDTPLEMLRISPSRSPSTEGIPGQPRVLVVDDEHGVRETIRRFLSLEGFDVATANDGQEALDLLLDETFDALLVDLYMPKLNGLELLAAMKERDLNVDVILTMSGEVDDESARRSLRLGAVDFVVKPVSLEYLAWTLRLRL